MQQISIQEVEEGIANLRAAEAKLMGLFGLKVHGTKKRKYTKRAKKSNGNGASAKLKARQLQGRYMGTLRGLSIDKRNMVKKERAEKGFRAALRLAKSLS